MKRPVLATIRWYQRAVSPGMPSACRFEPTCSEYALQAIETHGLLRGGWLAIRRLARCHPLHKPGYDPVPDVGRVSRETSSTR
jgi:putative membrane protein insertion efficiency factor